MGKKRMLAWLLAFTILTTVGGAFGEELDIVLFDEAEQQDELTIDLDVDASEDALTVRDDEMEDVLLLDPSEIRLEGDVPDGSAAATEGNGAVANGSSDGRRAVCSQPGGAADNDVLFAGYVDMLFGRLPQRNGYIGKTLTGVKKKLFDYLLAEIKKIAAGKRSSTMIDIPVSVIPESQWEEAFYAVNDVINALLADCPYYLYWYDKVYGTSYGCGDGRSLYCDFAVAEEYAKSIYETDAKKIQKAQIAVKNAKKVVRKYAGASDYRKLCGYRDYIMGAVEYNDAAIEDTKTPYGNPWQLIWAFDDDPSTDIVCEGYSKSFQYLCDLSSFNDGIRCYSVTGDGGTSPDDWGAHMWNIVTMEDGRNYHVDITFCDSGLPQDFLVGTPDTTEKGGAFYVVNGAACYHYDAETCSTFPKKVLKLSTQDYNPDKPKPTDIAITQGSSATVYMGNKLALKTRTEPKNAEKVLTWKSSKPKVATVSSNGTVTPKKAGKTVVTVKTDNGLTAKITVKVVDAKRIKIKEGKSKKLTIYKKMTLHVKASPSKVKPSLSWTSSNPKVAAVSNEGVVKGVGYGTATITATTANGKSAKIKIKVVDAKPEKIYEIKQ